jgi:YnbE-like lipoprotein
MITTWQRFFFRAIFGLSVAALGACTPTVKVATDEPITINLNVNIKHEILVKVDKQLDSVFSEDSDIF